MLLSVLFQNKSKSIFRKRNEYMIFLYYVYIGNIKKHKGIDILIKAINESNERGFDIKLVVVGDYKKIKTKDKNVMNLLNSANNNVLFTGFVPNDKLYDILSQSLALVLPTHYEGFGLPPLESLYLGGNAIITDLPVLREVYSELPVSFFKEGGCKCIGRIAYVKVAT
ncbi:glycosyltransferase [Bacteroides caccae]|nr:glycosyltransferase [Bacteroides caccae]